MTLDLLTLVVVAAVALAVSGALLTISWLQSPDLRALALWAAAFISASVGVGLIAARGHLTDVWSIVIANAILAASYGIMWAGVRNFEGRPAPVPFVLAGILAWLVACLFHAFYTAPAARATLMAIIIVAYSLLCALEFWRGRDDEQTSRLPIIVVLLVHAVIVVIRIPLAGAAVLPLPVGSGDPRVPWLTVVAFETVFYSFCLAYLFGGMARERIALWYKRASRTDPLTGVANRRHFLEHSERLLRRTTFERRPAAVLLFDIDQFKSVNDTFGHHAGDRVLMEFCRVATSVLRPGDLFGRLGGEEFAGFIPGSALQEGRAIAERIRVEFAAALLRPIDVTVSIGVAASTGAEQDLASLVMAADRALYQAKANGRNRVECAPEIAAVGLAHSSTNG